MTEALIIGYGNPLRADDGLGWMVAQRLAQIFRRRRVKVMACHQLTPELAEPISQVDDVIFIDAARGRKAGELVHEKLDPGPIGPVVWAHTMRPVTLLAYAKHLYGTCPDASLLSVGGASFDLKEGLSPSVKRTLPRLMAAIRRLLHTRRREVKSHA